MNIVKVAAGGVHSVACSADGAAYSWGFGEPMPRKVKLTLHTKATIKATTKANTKGDGGRGRGEGRGEGNAGDRGGGQAGSRRRTEEAGSTSMAYTPMAYTPRARRGRPLAVEVACGLSHSAVVREYVRKSDLLMSHTCMHTCTHVY